ncbi:MAG: SUMF1/EgtB/PvdO family nonheme iron enzyme [Puniceicoccales bacterium]|nr:SUMF1/EgtB/PvdO family nonheme iron enzyme [Puniceicoccales bacterium]
MALPRFQRSPIFKAASAAFAFAASGVAAGVAGSVAGGEFSGAAGGSFGSLFAPVARAYDNAIVPVNTPASARRLIDDLVKTHGAAGYPKGAEFLRRLDALEREAAAVKDFAPAPAEHKPLVTGHPVGRVAKLPVAFPPALQPKLDALIREAALANPILDFDKILCIRRKPQGGQVGFISLNSYTSADTVTKYGWDNEIAVLSNLRSPEGPTLTPLYRHPNKACIRDLDLHFDADKFLFSSINAKGAWAIYEKKFGSDTVRELTPTDQPDVQWIDPCYIAEDGSILAFSTAGIQGVPCVGGSVKVAALYRVTEQPGKPQPKVRQLTFEQDSGWHPRALNDGRVMYLRWQYTDTPHYFDRMLFTMHPDGRQQKALWGSGAYFPTAFKHPRPVPSHPSLVLGVVSGHHSRPEVGRLMLVDPRMGTHYPFRHDPVSKEWGKPGSPIELFPRVFPKEVTGCVQEIPGYGRDVIGNIYDNQGGDASYAFATPYPLDEKYYLTSMQYRGGRWGLWLVDKFDNMVKLYDLPDANLFEPVPIVKRKRPPVLPDLTQPDATESVVTVANIYHGRGLPGVPKGKAKYLRVIAYHFCYWNSGGHHSVGEHSGWDIKRILGTVPIEADGSVSFKIPANTPVAFQLLDKDGAAIQIMQSWTIAMPGEDVSCTGCHEPELESPIGRPSALALKKAPRTLEQWHGGNVPFAFETQIQPLLDRNCIGCHNDTNAKAVKGLISFTPKNTGAERGGAWNGDTAYRALHPYVRRPGPESYIETKKPYEWHVSTSELIQRLRRGHHNVKLSDQDWKTLYAWIDLNAPYRGAWGRPEWEKRRLELQACYDGNLYNPEEAHRQALAAAKKIRDEGKNIMPFVKLEPLAGATGGTTGSATGSNAGNATGAAPTVPTQPVRIAGNAPAAAAPAPAALRITVQAPPTNLPETLTVAGIKFRLIPAGAYPIGSDDGFPDERPRARVEIRKPYYIAETEITNEQYAAFDPAHDTGYENETGKDHPTPGYIANHPKQPVARVSWNEANDYCRWLSQKTGRKITLPTEAQWEWAARAGTDTPFYYGDRDTNFIPYANLADAGLRRSGGGFWGGSRLLPRTPFPKDYPFPLRDERFGEDKWLTVDYVGQYKPNAWGLYDTIGNVWEWTRTDYRPYPYSDTDGRNAGDPATLKVVRGGSHADRPKVISAAVRLPYEPFQKVHNVGLRPILEIE